MDKDKLAVVPLNKPDPEVIQRIEEALEMAKNGEIVNFSMVTINAQGQWSRCTVHPDKDIIKLIGALETTKTELILNHTEGIFPDYLYR